MCDPLVRLLPVGLMLLYQTLRIVVAPVRVTLGLPPESIERMVIYKPVEAGNLFGLGGGNGVWAHLHARELRPHIRFANVLTQCA